MERVDLVTPDDLEVRLRECLERRELPDYFLYVGEGGAGNWLELDRGDDFPVASSLTALLARSAPAVVGHLAPSTTLLSIGVGDGRKERLLLEAMVETGDPRYVAVDISRPMVDEALEAVADLPVNTTGITALCEDLARFRQYAGLPALVALLGNNFSNYEPDSLLGLIAGTLGPDDLLLVDAHVFPEAIVDEAGWRADVERIYRSPDNVRFNLGPLVAHGMDPSACSFRLELLPLDTPNGRVLRTRKQIEVLQDSILRIGEGTVELRAGDIISMGFTYKHTATQFEDCLSRNGFGIVERFATDDGDNVLLLARPPSARSRP